MRPDLSQWEQSRRYDYLDDLPVNELAWECLRRNRDYQSDYRDAFTDSTDERRDRLREHWGLQFRGATEPGCGRRAGSLDRESRRHHHHRHILPSCLSDARNLSSRLAVASFPVDEDGAHIRQPIGDRTLHLIRLPGVGKGAAIAAIIPLDPSGPERLVAVDQLLRVLLGQRVLPDRRLTRQKQRRLRHMLQACDGRESGATYREIATVLFGAGRVAADPWKSSALRDSVMALVRDGRAMIAGGYRTLLHHRR